MDKFINLFFNKFKISLEIKKNNISKKIITFQDIAENKSIVEKIYDKDFKLLGYEKYNKNKSLFNNFIHTKLFAFYYQNNF